MHLLGAPPFAFDMPAYGPPQAIDLLTGTLVACGVVVVGLAALAVFPFVYRALHALRHPIIITTVGGLILGILGFIGGPITMFKGLTQMGELLQDPTQYDAGQLAVIAGIKIVALLVAASALFRGGRMFPATFIGVALGLMVSALFPAPADEPRRRLRGDGHRAGRRARRLARALHRGRDPGRHRPAAGAVHRRAAGLAHGLACAGVPDHARTAPRDSRRTTTAPSRL